MDHILARYGSVMAYLKLTQIKLFVQVCRKIYFICVKNHVVMIGVLRGENRVCCKRQACARRATGRWRNREWGKLKQGVRAELPRGRRPAAARVRPASGGRRKVCRW
ncbi:TPA: hypothetical protein MHR78_25975 [Klebsiella variicola]|nr:hypothetical protein CWM64_26920 [Klebsiella sp. I-Nf8]PJR58637.1 hypothetical protein CWM61_28170 [Klebsiella sp. K-Nf6]PJX67083.1 hypothetical protein CWM57_26940 [Klebsiella sp. G-Nf4]PJX71102.1 hypothetical protein CWM55_26835 [Klebsiella sp. G2-16S-Nf13]PKJ72719.1 hypothetical protein CWM65_26880 [Klebsiella sp. J-Nf11]PLC80539.1 hypothetical protein B6I41_24795 [Klebsiella pneumoniae]PXH38984.1 hypothetical protein DMS67_27770 [Klebsiella variicola]